MLKLVLIAIILLNTMAIISIIFIEKKNPISALAWIIVLNVLPVIGFIFYIFLGSSQKLKLTSKKYKINEIEKYIVKLLKQKKIIENKDSDIFDINNKNYLNIATQNNNIKFFKSTTEGVNDLFKNILNAKESINIHFFILNTKSDVGIKLINLLTEKAKEGIKVKVTYDRIGSLKTRYKDFKELRRCGAEVYRHLPNIFRTIFQINYRNHRKMVIIDSKIAYTGGMNISDEYLNMSKKIFPWRDTLAKVTGDSVLFLQARFLLDFMYLKKLTKKRKFKIENEKTEIKKLLTTTKSDGKEKVQVIYNGPDTNYSHIRDVYIKLINDAKKDIYIESPYFIPDETMLDSIRIACDSGKNVNIIIPGVPDKKWVYYVTLTFAYKLLEVGAKVYLYKGFIHSKVIVTDEELTSFGTCNFDTRSFRLDYENNLVVQSKMVVKSVKENVFEDIKNSKKMTIKSIKKANKVEKFIALIFRLISPIL